MRRPWLRWAVAAAVTIAAFAAATWISGALVLPALKVHDPAVRWGIAGGLGVAVAALAALWGHSYATSESDPHQPGPAPGSASPTDRSAAPSGGTGQTRNTISGGTFQQPVIQSGSIGSLSLTSLTQDPEREARRAEIQAGLVNVRVTNNGGSVELDITNDGDQPVTKVELLDVQRHPPIPSGTWTSNPQTVPVRPTFWEVLRPHEEANTLIWLIDADGQHVTHFQAITYRLQFRDNDGQWWHRTPSTAPTRIDTPQTRL